MPGSVPSYCMFGDAGPFADATAIRKLQDRGGLPNTIVYMVHGAQSERTEVATVWNQFATGTAENKDGASI
jgi:hypothetical protein